MYSLAINTASSTTAFAIFKDKKLLTGLSWTSKNDQAEKLMPAIDQALQDQKISYNDLQEVYVVSGPGSFTGLRVGVTIANTLANLTNAKLFPITTFQYHHSNTKLPVFVFAGRGGVYFSKSLEQAPQLLTLEQAQALQTKKAAGDITPEQIQELSLQFQTVADPLKALENAINLPGLEETKLINPLYIKPPQITPSKKQFTI